MNKEILNTETPNHGETAEMATAHSMSSEPSSGSRHGQQFSIASTLWLTTAMAMLLAHARAIGTDPMLLLVCAVYCLIASAVFCLFSQQPKEVLYWSALMVMLGYLAVSGLRVFAFSQSCGWGMVGAVCGAFCGAQLMTSSWLSSVTTAVLGTASMCAVLWFFGEALHLEIWLDIVGAGAVGFALWHFVTFLRRFQVTSGQPRVVLAAWLTISVLVGNWFVALSGY